VYRALVGKPEGKRALGIPRCRWEDNIKMALQEVGFGGVTGSSWIMIGNRRRALVNAVMNYRFHEMWGIS
jgi:hypothetical protein